MSVLPELYVFNSEWGTVKCNIGVCVVGNKEGIQIVLRLWSDKIQDYLLKLHFR